MLENLGKVSEKMLKARLRLGVDKAGGLSESQHGFRMQRLTIEAIKKVVAAAHEAWQGSHRSRNACVLVTLDVKNAL